MKRKPYTATYQPPERDDEPSLKELGFAINEQGDIWNMVRADFSGAIVAPRLGGEADSTDLFWLHFIVGKRHVRIRLRRTAMRGLMHTMLALREATRLDD